jgi:HK97 family phage major capsid protein
MPDMKKVDINGQTIETTEPDVVSAVVAEIKSLGENTKANYDELRKTHEQLKSVVDNYGEKMAADITEQVTKLGEDITVRQQALDEQWTKRADSIETALQRVPKAVSNEDKAFNAEAMEFYKAAKIGQKKEGVTYNEMKALEPNLKEYAEYKDGFERFLRMKGDQRQMSPDHFKALSVGIDPDGGYTVTPAMSNRIITKQYETDPIRQLAAVESITTQAIEWMVDWGQAGWGWEAETETGAETTTPDLKKKRIPVHVMYAKPRATQTLLEDSGINIENWLADKVADRFSRGEGASFVTGTGVGQPRGFETYATGTSWGQVEQVAMGAAAALTADGFITVKYSLIEQYLNRGTWLMNRTTVRDAMYLKDGIGQYIWKPGFDKDSQATILGLPVRMSTTMPAVAANALSVALAYWKEAYMIVDRLGITIQRDPYTAKPFVEFYTRKRVGADVINFEAIKLGKISV